MSKTFPSDSHYLTDQLRRASLSVVLNIAEGSGKESDKDFNRYLNNSLGSINEVVACCEVARMEQLISEQQFVNVEKLALDVNNQLGGFSKKLKS